MEYTKYKIKNKRLLLSKPLLIRLLLKYPHLKIPDYENYSRDIKDYCAGNSQIPFFCSFDINEDGDDELIIVLVNRVFGGFGAILIICKNGSIYKLRWNRPVNALYFDYLIEVSGPKKYFKFGIQNGGDSEFVINNNHLVTRGYMTRVIYWDGNRFSQTKISSFRT